MPTDIFDDVEAEYEQLDAVLATLTPAQWSRPSAADGWTVSDVVLHLAQSEELAAASIAANITPFARMRAAAAAALADNLATAHRDIAPSTHQPSTGGPPSRPPPPPPPRAPPPTSAASPPAVWPSPTRR